MKILITGGAGFVGANLAVYLADRGTTITSLDNLVRRGAEYNVPRLRAAGVRFLHGDIRCAEDWPQEDFDVVLGTAAQPSAIGGYANPAFDLTNNLGAVFHTLEWCRQHHAALIFWSTNKVYPQKAVHDQYFRETEDEFIPDQAIDENCPLDGGDRSLYGATKVAADLLIQEYGNAFQILAIVNRFSCLAGPWQWGRTDQGWVAWWIIAHRLGLPLQYIGWGGKQVRDVLFIDDLCRLIDLQVHYLVNRHSIGVKVFNVGGGWKNRLSLIQATKLCQTMTGQQVPISTIEPSRRADFKAYVSNIDKVRQQFAWTPELGIETGMAQIDHWTRANLDTIRKVVEL